MPDILDSEKAKIRELAAQFAQNLWKISFTEGLKAYIQSSEEIYVHPARWKYCFKCGDILKKESMNGHDCSLEFKEFPILVQTSWYKLKQFFLTDRYSEILQDLGISELTRPKPVSMQPKVRVESKVTDPVAEKDSS